MAPPGLGVGRVLRLLLCCALPFLGAGAGLAEEAPSAAGGPIEQYLGRHGSLQDWLNPDPLQVRPGLRGDRPLPLYRALIERPMQAAARMEALADDIVRPAQSVHDHLLRLSRLAGAEVRRTPPSGGTGWHHDDGDPLARALDALAEARSEATWGLILPDATALPQPLRSVVSRVLQVFSDAERFRRVALGGLPPDLNAGMLIRQVTEGELLAFASPDFRTAIGSIDVNALFAGMQDVLGAAEALVAYLASTELPRVAWRLETPMGLILVDTTGQDNLHVLDDVLLLIDTGGNDRYVFRSAKREPGISVLIDLEGDDRYHALAVGADPSAAVLGYGLLWDGSGNDRYIGEHLAQAAGLFGVGVLVDKAGDDDYRAGGFAQAFALGGGAMLLDRAGDDRYAAISHAQASAGPQAASLLVEEGGDDIYHLLEAPLALPSPQNPARNVSMGQGAGWGWRADSLDGRSLAGGFGALIDVMGHDRYSAQVFAQGVGFWEGVGLLVDDAGHNHFDLAWYGLGAAAHAAVGIALMRGAGDDMYAVHENAALGAANDRSIAVFRDVGGSDRYRLAGMGLAAALDCGLAVFEDVAGDNVFEVEASNCRVFGQAWRSDGRTGLSLRPSAAVYRVAPADYKTHRRCAQAD